MATISTLLACAVLAVLLYRSIKVIREIKLERQVKASRSDHRPMGVIPDHALIELCKNGMIAPFLSDQVCAGISHGITSYGYDLRIGREFMLFFPVDGVFDSREYVDPKNFDPSLCQRIKLSADENVFMLPPRSFALAKTVERLHMPANVFALLTLKSTYARCGLIMPPTTFEPSFEGEITLELFNATPYPIAIYADEGIGQAVFFDCLPCGLTYADRDGKYMNQTGIQPPLAKWGE